jgi:hypothetical protein
MPGSDNSIEKESDLSESNAGGNDSEWEEWGGSENDLNDDTAKSLFDDSVLPSVEAALEHDKSKHDFDLRLYIKQVGKGNTKGSSIRARRILAELAKHRRHACAIVHLRCAAARVLHSRGIGKGSKL